VAQEPRISTHQAWRKQTALFSLGCELSEERVFRLGILELGNAP